MKSALAILLVLIIATVSGRGLEVCKHLSGSTHLFAGSQCDGEHGHSHGPAPLDEGHGHEHEESHSGHHGPGEHHEPCTHEAIQLDDEIVRNKACVASPSGVVDGLASLDHVVDSVDRSWRESRTCLSSSRSPPPALSSQRQFATTIRFLI